MWAPAQLYLSQHTGYQRIEWAQIKSTFSAADASKPRGGPDGQKNLDHPKVTYIPSHYDEGHLLPRSTQLTHNSVIFRRRSMICIRKSRLYACVLAAFKKETEERKGRKLTSPGVD